MGTVCISGDQHHIEIEKNLNLHDKVDRHIKKLLLLGAGSSGKSTLFKQLKCIHGQGFDENELSECKHVIRSNIVAGMLTLLRKSQELYDRDNIKFKDCFVDMTDISIREAIETVVAFSTESFMIDSLPEERKLKQLGESVGMLWDLSAVQNTFLLRGDKYSFPDNMDYFFKKSELLFGSSFRVSQEDALKTRVRTTGMIEVTYEIKENLFNIYDVGGQRNERKKWIHSFENVTAVIFVAALNHYNAVLFEDEKKNAMHESIELFEEISNSKWFRKTEMILFLNKEDLFKEKLREEQSLSQCFNIDYGWEGTQWNIDDDYVKCDDVQKDNEMFEYCFKTAIEFIQSEYVSKSKNPSKVVFCHVTTATNRDNIESVFWDVQNIIIRSNLKSGGLY